MFKDSAMHVQEQTSVNIHVLRASYSAARHFWAPSDLPSQAPSDLMGVLLSPRRDTKIVPHLAGAPPPCSPHDPQSDSHREVRIRARDLNVSGLHRSLVPKARWIRRESPEDLRLTPKPLAHGPWPPSRDTKVPVKPASVVRTGLNHHCNRAKLMTT